MYAHQKLLRNKYTLLIHEQWFKWWLPFQKESWRTRKMEQTLSIDEIKDIILNPEPWKHSFQATNIIFGSGAKVYNIWRISVLYWPGEDL